MTYVILALIKVFDNVIGTAKSIATYKEYKVISSILVVISQLLFYLVIDKVIEDNTMLAIIIVSISSGIGNYLAFSINGHFKKDAKWTMCLTTSNIADVKRFCNYLVEHKIRYMASDGYDRKMEPTINIIAFSKTKAESRLIEQYLATSESKYLKEII